MALTMSMAFSRSMRRTVSPMRRPMVVPLAFWISRNSWVSAVGTVTSPFRSLPLSSSSRAVMSLVRLATYCCWPAFWFRMVLPVSALNRYTASVSLAVWMGMGYTARPGSAAAAASASVSTSAVMRRKMVFLNMSVPPCICLPTHGKNFCFETAPTCRKGSDLLYYFKEYHKPAKREREKGGF